MRTQHSILFIFISFFLLIQPITLPGQDIDTPQQSKQRASLYYLGDNDDLLIKVNVWGFVQNPGQYLVPSDTDLITLISFAGGPAEEAKLNNVKLIRNQALIASQYSPSSSQYAMNGESAVPIETPHNDQLPKISEERVFDVDVEKYLKTGDGTLIPKLLPGDTVVIEGSAYHFISKVFDFASKLAVIAQIYFWVEVGQN